MTINLEIRDKAHCIALAYFCKRVTFNDVYPCAHGDEAECKDMAYRILDGLSDIEKSLSEAGFNAR